MRPLPVLSVVAAAALLATTAAPAAAVTETDGIGSAVSSALLVDLAGAGTDLQALEVLMPTSTSADGADAVVSVHPLRQDGADVVTPVVVEAGDEPVTLSPVVAGPAGLLELTSPSGTVQALLEAAGPVSSLAVDAGAVELLDVPLLGEGTFDAASAVTATTSSSTKSLSLDGLSLPSLLDVLEAVGLDVGALPVETLLGLLDLVQLPVEVSLEDLIALVESLDAGATVDDLVAVLDLSDAELAQLVGDAGQDAAIDELQTAIATLQALVPEVSAALLGTVLDPGDVTIIDGALTDLEDAVSGGTLDSALPLIDPATVEALEGLVLGEIDTQEELLALIALLEQALADIVTSLLEVVGLVPASGEDLLALLDVALLSTGAIEVSTLASTGATDAADVTGTIGDVKLLGNALLPSLDIDALLGEEGALTLLEGTLNGLLADVSEVLAGADELLGLGEGLELSIPLPVLDLLVVEEVLDTSTATKKATAGVQVLSLAWALDELQVPDVLSLLDGNPIGGDVVPLALPVADLEALATEPLSLTVGSLSDTSTFTPTQAPGGDGGSGGGPTPTTPVANPSPLPRTGPPALVAGLGLALVAAAAAVRRRRALEDDEQA